MFSLEAMRWKVLSVAMPLIVLAATDIAAATIGPGTLDLGNGARIVASSDDSTTLAGNPDNPPKSEIAAANLLIDANGRFALGTRVNITMAAGAQIATSIAVNPTNPNQIAIVGNGEEVVDTSSVRQDLILALSTDGGHTFTKRVVNSGGSRGQIVFDEFGVCYLAFVDRSTGAANATLRVQSSMDGCLSFLDEFSVAADGSDFSLVAAHDGVQVSQFIPQNQTIAVNTVRTFEIPGGKLGFQTAARDGTSLHQLATGIDGAVAIAYQHANPNSISPTVNPSCSLFVAVDADGADLGDYSAPVLLTHGACSSVQVKVDRGTSTTRSRIYVFYSDEVGSVGSRRTASFLRYSDDNGATWSTSVELKDSAGNALALGAVDVDISGRIAVLNGLTVATLAPPFSLALPNSPINLSVVGSTRGQVNLTWTDRATNETGYQVDRQVLVSGQSSPFTQIATLGVGANSFTDSSLPPNTLNATVTYRVRAINGSLVSADSNSLVVQASSSDTVVAAPSNLTATVLSGSSVALAWRDNSANETGFVIERSLDGAAFSAVASTGANAATFTDTGLQANRQYSYRVSARANSGASDPSNVATVVTSTLTAPNAPTNLIATGGSRSVTLRWRDNSNNETRFEIQRSTDGTNFTSIGLAGANATSFTDTGLPAARRFFYRIRAVNMPASGSQAATSAFTNTANATTRR